MTTNNIAFRDVCSAIPSFNGKNIPVRDFLRTCRKAAEMVPEIDQLRFLNIISLKLFGSAADIADSKTHLTLEALLRDLRNAFEKPVELSDLELELTSSVQNYNESVRDYAMRTRKIAKRIEEQLNEVYTEQHQQQYLENRIQEARQTAIKAFIRGLFDRIANIIIQQNFLTLNNAVDEAINIENELARRQTFHQTTKREKFEARENRPNKAKIRSTQSDEQYGQKFCEKRFDHPTQLTSDHYSVNRMRENIHSRSNNDQNRDRNVRDQIDYSDRDSHDKYDYRNRDSRDCNYRDNTRNRNYRDNSRDQDYRDNSRDQNYGNYSRYCKNNSRDKNYQNNSRDNYNNSCGNYNDSCDNSRDNYNNPRNNQNNSRRDDSRDRNCQRDRKYHDNSRDNYRNNYRDNSHNRNYRDSSRDRNCRNRSRNSQISDQQSSLDIAQIEQIFQRLLKQKEVKCSTRLRNNNQVSTAYDANAEKTKQVFPKQTQQPREETNQLPKTKESKQITESVPIKIDSSIDNETPQTETSDNEVELIKIPIRKPTRPKLKGIRRIKLQRKLIEKCLADSSEDEEGEINEVCKRLRQQEEKSPTRQQNGKSPTRQQKGKSPTRQQKENSPTRQQKEKSPMRPNYTESLSQHSKSEIREKVSPDGKAGYLYGDKSEYKDGNRVESNLGGNPGNFYGEANGTVIEDIDGKRIETRKQDNHMAKKQENGTENEAESENRHFNKQGFKPLPTNVGESSGDENSGKPPVKPTFRSPPTTTQEKDSPPKTVRISVLLDNSLPTRNKKISDSENSVQPSIQLNPKLSREHYAVKLENQPVNSDTTNETLSPPTAIDLREFVPLWHQETNVSEKNEHTIPQEVPPNFRSPSISTKARELENLPLRFNFVGYIPPIKAERTDNAEQHPVQNPVQPNFRSPSLHEEINITDLRTAQTSVPPNVKSPPILHCISNCRISPGSA